MWGSFARVFNLFLLHLLFVFLSDVGGVGHSVRLVPVIFVIYQGEGGGPVLGPSIGESQLTKLTR